MFSLARHITTRLKTFIFVCDNDVYLSTEFLIKTVIKEHKLCLLFKVLIYAICCPINILVGNEILARTVGRMYKKNA